MTKSTEEEDYDMTALDKVQWPGVANILEATTQIAAVLGDYPCEAVGAEDYGHQFLIYSSAIWLTLDNITQEVVVNKPATFTGNTHAERHIHDMKLKTYHEKEKHQKGAIRMIKYIFPSEVFIDLQNSQGLMVGKTPVEIMEHLKDTFCDDEEIEKEILMQEDNLKVKYNPAELPQAYFAKLQNAKTILMFLKETASDKKLIRFAVNQFEKHADLYTAIDEWKRKIAANKTWSNFKSFFSKQITMMKKRGGTLRDIGIANQVQIKEQQENTECMAQVQLQQAQTIADLRNELKLVQNHQANAAYPAKPEKTATPTTGTDQAAQMTAMFKAFMDNSNKENNNNTSRSSGRRRHNRQDNDLPGGERTVRRHPNSNACCSTCGFDLPEAHTSATCKHQKEGHNKAHTVTNRVGGSTRNCFHCKP